MFEILLLIAVIALTGWNFAIHNYTQLVTYALFPRVAALTGGPGFVEYHQAYERRLPVAIYAPWAALTAASAVLVFVRPSGFPLWVAIVLLILNASIAPLSLAFAAPIHRRVDRTRELTPTAARALFRWNGVRLAVMSVSLVLSVGTSAIALA